MLMARIIRAIATTIISLFFMVASYVSDFKYPMSCCFAADCDKKAAANTN